MKYNLRGYMDANRMTLHQTFCKAWRDTYKQTPNFPLVAEDLDRYLNCGAMPPYLTDFIKKQTIPKLSYFAWWNKEEVRT